MTEVAIMPPILSMPSQETDEDIAFTVLNQDNLPITIVGENILKPFGREYQKTKPNVIVHPTRRLPTTNLEDKPFTKSNGFINAITNNTNDKQRNLKKNFSNSYGNLNHTNSASKMRLDELKNQFDMKFTKTLDAKLRKLQRDEKQNGSKKQQVEVVRKPFVTTVKKGQFLEPPPEIACLIGMKVEELVRKEEKKLYAYASQPRVLNRAPVKSVHQATCDAAARAAAKVAGSVIGVQASEDFKNNNNVSKRIKDVPLPYANLMFEKRIFRGSNFAPNNLCDHIGDGESGAARAAEVRRRAQARKKAKNQQIRSADLHLGSPPAIQGRRHEKVQTENYLEELFVNPEVRDTCTQTDLFLERPVSPFYVPAKTGMDVETQIYPGDLFDFDMEVQPILEVLVGKTVEQALIEVLEEEELAALREQQRRFLELRAAETDEAQRIEEREKRLVIEKEQKLAELEEGLRLQKEMEERIAAAVLMQGYMANLLPSVLEGLESEGFLVDSIKQDIDESFMPWLMKEVTQELTDMVSSRDVLTEIVREILENRAEIYAALNKEPEPEEGEEGPTMEDMVLQDHLKLQNEIIQGEKRQSETTEAVQE